MTDIAGNPPDEHPDLPPPEVAPEEDSESASYTLLGIRTRAGLEKETGTLRFIAFLDISLSIAILLVLIVFVGLDDFSEQLFILSAGHFILAPIVAYTTVRFGAALYVAFGFAAVQFGLDLIELVVRAFSFSLTTEQVILLVANVVLLAFCGAYIFLLYRVYTVVRRQNERAREVNAASFTPAQLAEHTMAARARLVQQEANTIRLTALFGLVGVLVALLSAFVLLSFSRPAVLLLLFSTGHIFVAIYALLFGTSSPAWIFTSILLVAAIILLLLDGLQIFLRLRLFSGSLTAVSFNAIVNITLLLINIAFLLVDVMYLLSSIGYLYIDQTGAVEDTAVAEQAVADTSPEQPMSLLSAMSLMRSDMNVLRKRKP